MFLVKDTSSAREARIRTFLADDPSIAALLAVVHVEWTLRRAIIALGVSPNRDVRALLRECHGLARYKSAWRQEVRPRTNRHLAEVVADWQGLRSAFNTRHVLVHGVRAVSFDYAVQRAEWALAAAGDIRAFAASHSVDLDRRLPVRRRPR
jgi:hypothetical protein